MSWYVSLGGWLTGAAGMGAIAVLIVLAVASNFFNKAVSTAAWLLAVGSLALISVSKDAVIATAAADMATYKANAETERAAAKDKLIRVEREARDRQHAAVSQALAEKRQTETELETLKYELEEALRKHPEMAERTVPDDVVRLLNRTASVAAGPVEPSAAPGGVRAGLRDPSTSGGEAELRGSRSLGARLRAGLGLRAPE